ncbi:hypothetical protein DEO72_LG7g962 [Vigna unguiculata]|uniref:Transposase n=1 Tax=Vigna unguiculata TaxID=3917 RepID=A0A4D6MHF6_VIGUN|nr:hypothetical protein DEO72_LG7g962 [Vigna unguiculata]
MASSSSSRKRIKRMATKQRDPDIDGWISIPTHRGFPGINRLDIYQGCLWDPTAKRDYSIFRAGGMKKDERVLAFLIAWILVPRNVNHAQLTREDVFLIHAFKSNILINWSEVVSDTMQKAIKLPNYPLPYVVFVCKVLEHYKVNLSGEASYTPNHKFDWCKCPSPHGNLDSIEHQLTSVQEQLALLNTGCDPPNPKADVDTAEGSESE